MGKMKKLFLILLFLNLSLIDIHADEIFYEHFKKGVIHFNRKEYEASIEFLRKALGRIPEDTRARYFLALAYYKAGFEENAIFEFNTIIENTDGDAISRNFVTYLNRKQFLISNMKKNDDYTLGMEIIGNPIGKYIVSKATGIDVDDSGNIYISGFGSKIALKISQEGEAILAFTSPKISHGRLYDIVVGKNGIVYISDYTNDTIYTFTVDGKYLDSIGTSGFGEGQFYGPASLALDNNNNLYVIDSGNMRVEKFSEAGDFLLAFGKRGDAEGEFDHPSGIAVDYSGKIYIADHGKRAIYVYDESGNFITILKNVQLTGPYGISFADDNTLIVNDGTKIWSYDLLYSTWREIDTAERLKRVLDSKVDRLGQLYACDFENDTIVQFVPKADKYRNINVILNRVDTDSYPTIVYYVSVLSADGLPLYGLSRNHFLLKIGEGSVGKVDLSYNEVRDSRLNILFLVDKSLSMQEYSEDIKSYIGQFINKVSAQDEMAVIGFNKDSWISSPFTTSRLSIMDAISEERFDSGKAFDKAFRKSIDYLNKMFYKKVIIVITDGTLSDESFLTYSFESCKNYASNNNIPVYILSFGGRMNEKLEHFAKSTGGRFYDVFHSNDFMYLYKTIRSHRSPEYIIFFNDVYDSKLKDLYVDAEVEVDFNGRIGKNHLGFIYP